MTDAETVLSACAVEVSNTLIDGPPALYNDYDRLKREKVEMFYEKINRKLAKGEDTQFTLHRRAMSPSKREPFPKVESVTVYDIIGMAVNAASEMGVDVSSAIENMKKQKLLETLE
ncbi:MAG: hypothetical protein JW716_03550 [Candidatus Aenigmarchaeota archaeon]|nr:hypothetical protein [Candidatus Aenigmarchaeota archaeon]